MTDTDAKIEKKRNRIELIRIHQYIDNAKIMRLWRIVSNPPRCIFWRGGPLPSTCAEVHYSARLLGSRLYDADFPKNQQWGRAQSLRDTRCIWGGYIHLSELRESPGPPEAYAEKRLRLHGSRPPRGGVEPSGRRIHRRNIRRSC